ncbi:MAG TPA: hypothetical protein VGK27_09615 [Candidatus Deferrimicrobiaceae bacterium]|jgi:hypothetical protein
MGELIREGSLTEILYRSRIVTDDDVRKALEAQERQGGRMGELLVSQGSVTQEDIDWALSNQLNIPLVRLDPKAIDPEAVKAVPAELARRHGLIPLLRIGEEISIAMIDPLDKEAVRAVEEATGLGVAVSIAMAREVQEMQALFYGRPAVEASLCLETEIIPPQALARVNGDMTGTSCADLFLKQMVLERWEALVGQPGDGRAILSARESGTLREVGRLPYEGYKILVGRLRRLGALEGESAAQWGTFSTRIEGREHGFQLALLQGADADCMTVRKRVLAPFPDAIESFLASPEQKTAFAALAEAGRGIILFCGRDEDARRRLMDLYLGILDTRGRNVLLFGEAVGGGSGRFPRISLRGRAEAEAQGLVLASIDHDADIVAIEDATDERLFAAAGKVAMRGKLVLVGLPFDARSALFTHLDRLQERRAFIPGHLRGVVACRGVLTLCPACREEYVPSPEDLATLALPALPERFFRSPGCPVCDHTGHGGRSFLLDAVPFTGDLRGRFEFPPRDEGIEATGRALLASGEISPDEYIAAFVL